MFAKNASILQAATTQAISELETAIKIVRSTGDRLSNLFPPGSAFHKCFNCVYCHSGEFRFTRKDGLPIPYVQSNNGNKLAVCFRSTRECGGTLKNPVDIVLPKEVVDIVNKAMEDSKNGIELSLYTNGGGNVINEDGSPASRSGGLAHLLMKAQQQDKPSH